MTDREPQKKLSQRLRRAEGQVAAVRRMLDDEAPCLDILVQLSAAQGALSKAAQVLLASHIEESVQATLDTEDQADRAARVSDLMHVFNRYSRIGG